MTSERASFFGAYAGVFTFCTHRDASADAAALARGFSRQPLLNAELGRPHRLSEKCCGPVVELRNMNDMR